MFFLHSKLIPKQEFLEVSNYQVQMEKVLPDAINFFIGL